MGKPRKPVPAPGNNLPAALPKPSKAGMQGQSRPAPVAAKFDLSTCPQVYEQRRQVWSTFFNTRILPIDNYAEGRRTTDYWTLRGPDGQNLIYQVQDQTIPNVIEKTVAYITPESVNVSVPPDLNPLMTDDQRDIVAAFMSYVWDAQKLYGDGDPFYERARAVMARGTYIAGYEWLEPQDADMLMDDLPLRGRLYDVMECGWSLDANGRVESIIIGQRKFASEIPDDELKQVGQGDTDPSKELETWTYWDRVQWGRTIGGVITRPLQPHGLFYPDGTTPMCPFVVCMHRPRVIRNGSVAPQVSGLSQIGRKIGIPPTYYLLSSSEILSRVETVQMENIRRVGLATIYEKGRVKRPNDTGLDLTEVSIELDDKGELGFVTPPDVNANADRFTGMIRDNFSGPAGVDNQQLRGTQGQPTSGITQSGQTSWTRSAAQAVSLTLGTGMTAETHVMAGICRSKLSASPIDQVQQMHGEKLPTMGGEKDPLNQGVTIPFAFKSIGGKVDDLTFAQFRRAKVSVTPDTRLSPEQKMQVGTQLILAKDQQTGRTVFPLSVILTKFFDGIFDSPEEIEKLIALDEVAAQPGSPLKVIDQAAAVINRFTALMGEEASQQATDALGAYIQQNIPQFVQSLLATPMQPAGGTPQQPQGPPPPGGPPGNLPPPTGPPPGPPPPGPPPPGPMLPGQMPFAAPPGSPMQVPPGQMAPGGGNPAAAMPPPLPPPQGPSYG